MYKENTANYQWLSELTDDAVNEDVNLKDAVNQLTADVNLLNRWQRYHMIRETMRGGLPETINIDLTDNIMAKIAQEDLVKTDTVEQARFKLPPIWESVLSFSLTVVVAIAIVFAYDWVEDNSDSMQLAVQKHEPIQAAGLLALSEHSVTPTPIEAHNTSPPVDMNLYLLSHAEYATTPTMVPRILPYARLSSFNTAEQ